MTLSKGTRLGPYEILAPLGAGGMGEVYRARDTRLGREVAVKVLPETFAEDPDRLRRFEQEARAASALNHPNILTIHDVGREQRLSYVVFELLEGETLRQQLSSGPLAVAKAIDYGVEIARGLAAAHEKGIVHRDLKPENIFVTRDDRVKILDFGLAKLTHPERTIGSLTEAATRTADTEPGVVMGTLAYMSPEQVRGLPVDRRSDIFSFGGVLYEMVTGRRAFPGSTPADTMSAILREEPAEMSDRSAPSSGDLERVVRRCLEKNPEARFQSARDLAFALDACDTTRSSTDRPRVKIGAILAVAAGALAILAVVLVANGRRSAQRLPGSGRAARIASIAVLPLRDLSATEGQEFFADGITAAVTAELGGIRSLKVISSSSALQYKASKKPVREIARELGVDALVEGSVTRAGDRVSVTTELVRADTDSHLWAKRFQGELGGILVLQDDIAREVARQVEAGLSTEEERRLTTSASIDPRAYEAYLKGRFFLEEGTEESLGKALDQFHRALELQRDYAAAYAGLAQYYAVLPFYSALAPAEVFPKARAAAEKALELDAGLPEAHASLAYIRAYYEWDWKAAEHEFQRALELRPSYADARFSYSRFLAAAGRLDEALSEIAHARALDPRSSLLVTNTALLHYFGGQYDEALRELLEIRKSEPGSAVAHWGIGLCYEQKGAAESAISALQKAASLSGSHNFQSSLAHAYAVFGRTSEARQILNAMQESARGSYVPSYFFAIIFAGTAQHDLAFEWLERAYQERSTVLAYVRLDPRLAPLRADPRFGKFLERLGLPDAGARVGFPQKPGSP